jgi:hypothetical protein
MPWLIAWRYQKRRFALHIWSVLHYISRDVTYDSSLLFKLLSNDDFHPELISLFE